MDLFTQRPSRINTKSTKSTTPAIPATSSTPVVPFTFSNPVQTTPITLPTPVISPNNFVISPPSQQTTPTTPTPPRQQVSIPFSFSPATPPTPERMYSQKMNDKLSVENILRNYYYEPLNKVSVKTPQGNGEVVVEYIKAYNPHGIIVFVQLNNEGYVSIDRNDLTLTKIGVSDIVPYSTRRSSYDMVTPHSTGVAIESKGGVCTIERGTTGSPVESNYVQDVTITERKGDSYMSDDALISHPIVSLVEIMTNPMLVIENTDISNKRLIRHALETRQHDRDKLELAYKNFGQQAKRFYVLSLQLEDYLSRIDEAEIKKVDNYLQKAAKSQEIGSGVCNPCVDGIETTMENLKLVSNINIELTKYCRVLSGIADRTAQMTEDIGEMAGKLESHASLFNSGA